MAENALIGDVLTGDALQAYFLDEREKHRALLERWAKAVVLIPFLIAGRSARRGVPPFCVTDRRGPRGSPHMLTADRIIAGALMALSLYFMWHATVLPIGWVEGEGPGGGAFPFWLSAIMFVCADRDPLRSLRCDLHRRSPFFDPETRRPLA